MQKQNLMEGFSNVLEVWYLSKNRDLPWRKVRDPYAVWLSEIILQQTRVAQGISYYERFLDAFPTVFDLAKASEEQVLKLWQGLGYYSRARNLHFSARFIASELKGVFPSTLQGLVGTEGGGRLHRICHSFHFFWCAHSRCRWKRVPCLVSVFWNRHTYQF